MKQIVVTLVACCVIVPLFLVYISHGHDPRLEVAKKKALDRLDNLLSLSGRHVFSALKMDGKECLDYVLDLSSREEVVQAVYEREDNGLANRRRPAIIELVSLHQDRARGSFPRRPRPTDQTWHGGNEAAARAVTMDAVRCRLQSRAPNRRTPCRIRPVVNFSKPFLWRQLR